jgi:MSHA biogenesis protein MshN
MQGADSEAAPQRSAPPAKQKPEAGVSMKSISAAQQSDNLYRQSVTLLQQGRVAEAQDALRKSLDANARNLKARQSLVGLMVESKHPDEAVSLLKEGLKLSPEQTVFSMALSRLQVEAGDSKGARDTLEQGLQYAGDDAEFHAFYAALLQRNEQHEEAVQHYLTALRADPAMPTWLIGVGISLQAQGNANDAIAAFQRARDTGQLTPQLKQFVEQRLRQLKPYR